MRLPKIYAASEEQMETFFAAQTVDVLKAAYSEMLEGALTHPELSFVAELDGKIVGHFLFSRFPLSKTPQGGHGGANDTDIVMLAPVSVHADFLRQGIGSAMLKLGIQKVKETGFNGIIVEGNYKFYNTVGFRTSSEYGIYPVSGYPMTEPRCQMCMETYFDSRQPKAKRKPLSEIWSGDGVGAAIPIGIYSAKQRKQDEERL